MSRTGPPVREVAAIGAPILEDGDPSWTRSSIGNAQDNRQSPRWQRHRDVSSARLQARSQKVVCALASGLRARRTAAAAASVATLAGGCD
jgi:hypothetical protein